MTIYFLALSHGQAPDILCFLGCIDKVHNFFTPQSVTLSQVLFSLPADDLWFWTLFGGKVLTLSQSSPGVLESLFLLQIPIGLMVWMKPTSWAVHPKAQVVVRQAGGRNGMRKAFFIRSPL